ncbi:cuticle protein 10.9-like [Tropilaelaps mercedesae]|uniref:Cuticle protein 10.9-like n=1 Tax=Tropilaelaps mercedesae TaxID=418985 RepID=A0A1V9XF48_9ACAR|nr:cuticle protein 10.9-like [Tropilaelaps mercedesae]
MKLVNGVGLHPDIEGVRPAVDKIASGFIFIVGVDEADYIIMFTFGSLLSFQFLIVGVLASCLYGTAVGQLGQVRALNIDNSGAYIANQQYPPTPYEYAYSSEDIEGTHSAQQSGDGNGRVQGSYTMTLADGRTRTVTYVADENGYRAEVTTNELGTESKNPADVIINSSAITGEQAAIQYGPPAPERQIVARPGQLTGQLTRQVQVRQLNNAVALPSYGTFAGVQG